MQRPTGRLYWGVPQAGKRNLGRQRTRERRAASFHVGEVPRHAEARAWDSTVGWARKCRASRTRTLVDEHAWWEGRGTVEFFFLRRFPKMFGLTLVENPRDALQLRWCWPDVECQLMHGAHSPPLGCEGECAQRAGGARKGFCSAVPVSHFDPVYPHLGRLLDHHLRECRFHRNEHQRHTLQARGVNFRVIEDRPVI